MNYIHPKLIQNKILDAPIPEAYTNCAGNFMRRIWTRGWLGDFKLFDYSYRHQFLDGIKDGSFVL
ncbi:hypothetical protein HZS_816 [Henneguya salminicola]|nr:hypothetical protein HZS_816 [Henneguya salminicola]